jgi:hypothetical protein
MPAFFYVQDVRYVAVAGMQWSVPLLQLQKDVIDVM